MPQIYPNEYLKLFCLMLFWVKQYVFLLHGLVIYVFAMFEKILVL